MLNGNNHSNERIRLVLCSLLLIGVTLLIRIAYFSTLKQITIYPDSIEYIEAGQKLAALRIDMARVPGYPILIELGGMIFHSLKLESAVVCVQLLISIMTVILTFHTAKNLFNSIFKAFLTAVFVSISIGLVNWDFLILTESLTAFLVIVLVSICIFYIKSKSKVCFCLVTMVNIALVFTKPFYLFFPLVIAAAIVTPGLFKCYSKRAFIPGILLLILVYSSVIAHSCLNYYQNGYFGISNIGSVNQLGKILQYDMYRFGAEGKIKDSIIEEVKQHEGQVLEPVYIIAKYGLYKDNYAELSKFTGDIIKKHPVLFIYRTYEYISRDMLDLKLFTDYNAQNYKAEWPITLFKATNDMPFINSFAFLLLLLSLEIMVLGYKAVKHKSYDWNWFMIYMIIIYQLLMTVFGSHGEYPRLLMPACILIILLSFKYIYAAAGISARLLDSVSKGEKSSLGQ